MLTLGRKTLSVPILQGGMGVGVSLGGLAGAVAACGGMGCISTADAGYREPDFARDPASANHRALTAEIRKAKEPSPRARGWWPSTRWWPRRTMRPRSAPRWKRAWTRWCPARACRWSCPASWARREVAIAPIVSSGRAAKLILRRWAKEFGRTADFVVIEGCKAGGHLGFAEADLLAGHCQSLDDILPEVLAEVQPFEAQFGRMPSPCIRGGRRVHRGRHGPLYRKRGAAGVQLATRFIPTYECDASPGLQGRAAGRPAGGCADHPQPGGHAGPGAEHPAGAGAGSRGPASLPGTVPAA